MARVIETPADSAASDRLRPLRYAWRVPQLLLHALVAVPLALLALNPLAARVRIGSTTFEKAMIRWWSGRLVRIFGFRLRRFGQPLPGASCTVSTASGSWNVVTPATVQIGSPNGDLHVVCNKDGFRTSELLFKPSSTSGSSLGLGVGGGGGHVGVGLGMSMPITMGSGSYPSRVSVELNPQQ